MVNEQKFLDVALANRGKVFELKSLLDVFAENEVFGQGEHFQGNKPFLTVLKEDGYCVGRDGMNYRVKLGLVSGSCYFDISLMD